MRIVFIFGVLAGFALCVGAPAQGPSSGDRIKALEALDRAARAAEDAARSAQEAARSARIALQAARDAAVAAGVALPGSAEEVSRQSAAALPAHVPSEIEEVAPPPPSALVERARITPTAIEGVETAEAQTARSLSASVLDGTNDGVTKYTRLPDFELLMSSKDKVASLSWTAILNSKLDDNAASFDLRDRTAETVYQSNALTLTATTKLNEGEGTFATLDGFTGGTEGKITFTHYEGRIKLGGLPTFFETIAAAERICREQNGLVDEPVGDKKATDNQCKASELDSGGASKFIARYYPLGLRSANKAIFSKTMTYWGSSVGVNQTEFAYIDRANFKEEKSSKLGIVSSAFLGWLFNEGQTSATVNFSYRRKFKAGDTVMLCQPITTPLTQCLTGADGAPTRKDAKILGFDLRQAFPSSAWNYTRVALAPKVSYDFANKIVGVDVPVYLARDETGQLRGGIRGSFTDKPKKDGGRESDFTLGIFIGLPFSIFAN